AAAVSLATLTILSACATAAGPRDAAAATAESSPTGRIAHGTPTSIAGMGPAPAGEAGPVEPASAPAPALGQYPADRKIAGPPAGASGPEPDSRAWLAAGQFTTEKRIDPAVRTLVRSMSLEEKVGQLLMIAVEDPKTHREIPTIDSRFRALIDRVKPGGIILFGGNLVTVPQTIHLISELQQRSRIPLFVATDEEGGEVSRLNASGKIPATPVPSAWVIGEANDPELAYEAGRVIGQELAAIGLNMDLAPDADVLTNPENRVIGTRSFGAGPTVVARMVAAVVRGIQDEGVSAVIKHFPGHGDTANDTHVKAAVVYSDRARLDAVELVPFKSGISAGVDGIMTAHIGLPEITGSAEPATLSPAIVDGILRHDLGFQGVVFTDAMNMAALDSYTSQTQAVVAAVLAGCDVILRPLDARAAFDSLVQAVHGGRISEERLDRSVERILSLKYERNLFERGRSQLTVARAETILGTPAHRSVMDRIIEAAKLRSESKKSTASR
ncbi:MAG TPA: glycoside hydrolase family 3 protein, partial [Spirochaetia bacterium]|nr:glycoside hydrolase family 3 protein [Spirochaetia bacterium]